jgi:hypothetical protein
MTLNSGIRRRFRPVSIHHRRDRGVRWSTGPGLFFALALLILGAGRARAETAVGLDARGVDPMAAVDNSSGLDVRDALGRPVSGAAVLAELKKAAVARAAETAYASPLPRAKAVLPALENTASAVLSLVRLIETVPGRVEWASLPSPAPKLALWILAVPGAVLFAAAAAFRPRASLPALSSCRRGFEVLRC